MHIKSLQVFCDVVNRRSFSRAADKNGISQSGASQMVHQLEDRLGVKLIDRSKRPFVLTQEGETYYLGCRRIIAEYKALEERVRAAHKQMAGQVHVASIYSVGLSFMKEFVQEFSKLYPQAQVRLEYAHPDRVYELVRNGQADLGLVSYPQASRVLEATPWREEPMVLVMAPNHPLASRREVTIADLNGVEMACFDQNLRIRREIDRVLAQAGVSTRVAVEFDNIETLKRAIEINAGVSILPEATVSREREYGSLISARLAGQPLNRPVGIIHGRSKQLGETAQRFMQLLLTSGDAAVEANAAGDPLTTESSGPIAADTSPGAAETTKA
ncbi:MAG: LysR family transcriptional regulator [Pirellulaceae bacterium]|jgi:DNA-binding transcriptional LysR family regulator|nr:LysR family transcriptional regulator [Pirellulaceae bacterium]MDP7016714.1 LysR family transcriptional regulator [Pirellulaceae bacterium]